MAVTREMVLRLAAQRAGLSDTQLDALRRRDYTALLAEHLTAPPDAEQVVEEAPATPSVDAGRLTRRLAAVRRQRDAALQMLAQLAAKLGCCPSCWGTDAACAACGGAGSPGHFPPDPHLRAWLGPALTPRPHARTTRRRRHTAGAARNAGSTTEGPRNADTSDMRGDGRGRSR